jgi:hypothetical protein
MRGIRHQPAIRVDNLHRDVGEIVPVGSYFGTIELQSQGCRSAGSLQFAASDLPPCQIGGHHQPSRLINHLNPRRGGFFGQHRPILNQFTIQFDRYAVSGGEDADVERLALCPGPGPTFKLTAPAPKERTLLLSVRDRPLDRDLQWAEPPNDVTGERLGPLLSDQVEVAAGRAEPRICVRAERFSGKRVRPIAASPR